ncbi:MAG: bifunctional phosphoribosylaminoimidazolecarboxamide formyltransferase/IMP cyclohydrolase [Magnetococcus sp. WYHC-3]
MAEIKRALISVSDKTGLAELGMALARLGVKILSTGGTAKRLAELGISVTDVSSHTGFPEMMDGRVKTLHPRIHGGLLGILDNPRHVAQMREYDLPAINLVVVNLYPFERTVADPHCPLPHAIEQIDIGGPSMVRSAAKNYRFVTVVTDPSDYPDIIRELLDNDGRISESTNFRLARRAFARTAAYDAAISNWLTAREMDGTSVTFPESFTVQFHKSQEMRYGENPHQSAAFYVEPGVSEPCVATARPLQGKELSFNNINDANGAFELVKEFDQPAAVVVKHTNPSGVCLDDNLLTAYRKARDTDPVSAFGGILAFNREVGEELAREITATFVEAVIAPGFTPAALTQFATKKNLRLLLTPPLDRSAMDRNAWDMKRVVGGLLLQNRDLVQVGPADLRVVTRRTPEPDELRDLLFAWKVCKHVKSNAIVYARDLCTVGVGAGQMSRVDSSRIAVWKAREAAQQAGRSDNPVTGSVLASDAFFPFRDGVDAAADAGARAVIQPGGSVRDEEVIAAADEHGMAMVFTGHRHFRH